MFKTLLKKEILSHLLTLRFAVAFALITLFVFGGFYVSVIEYKKNVDDYHTLDRMAKENKEQILKETSAEWKLDRLLWLEGIIAAIPVSKLSAVSQGLASSWPSAININGVGTFNLGGSIARNPMTRLFPVPDYVYIINAILSLFAILFIFDSVCGEKEAGTLRLTLSFSVPRHLILLSKWLGGYIVLMAPFVVSTLGGLGFAWISGALDLSGGNLILIMLLVFIAAIYISVFFTMGLFVSTITKKAFTSLFISLFLWVFFILIIPNLSPIMSRIISPTPSPRKIEAEKNAVDKEIDLRIHSAWREGGGFGNETEQKVQKLREEGKYRKSRWDRFLKQAQEKQTNISETLGRLSPSSSWIYASHSLVKTGPEAYRNVVEGRDRLKRDMEDYSQSMWDAWEKKQMPPEVIPENIPDLHIQFYDNGKAVAVALNDILLLIIFNVLFFMLSFYFFLRYDVR